MGRRVATYAHRNRCGCGRSPGVCHAATPARWPVVPNGIVYGRKLAEPGAAALAQWMADKSGLTAVREQITRRFVYRSDVLKARQILPKLQELGAASPYRPSIDSILENARMQPGLHRLHEVSALELMLQWDPAHPLVEEVDHLSVSATPAEGLRLPPGADQATINDAAQRACLRCRRERLAHSQQPSARPGPFWNAAISFCLPDGETA